MWGPAPVDLPPPPPLRPRGVGEILEAAFGLYARHWRSLVPIVAIVVVPLTLVQYLLASGVSGGVTTAANGQTVNVNGGAVAGSLLLALLSIFIQQILTGALAWAVATILVGREPELASSYRFGYRHLWGVLLVSILFGLAVVGGTILFIVPGIIFAVRFSVSIPALVVEGKRGTEALSRSWNLVRGRSWPVFGAFIVVFFLTGLLRNALTAAGGSSWFGMGIMASIAAVITTPFTGLVLGLIYFDLRVRKEQLDIPTLEADLRRAASS